MQRKGRVEKVNMLCREKPPVEGTGHGGGEVRWVIMRWRKELKEGVEVVGREVAEEGRELRWLVPRRLVALSHALDDEFHHVYGVAAARAAQVRHREAVLRRAQRHAVESFTQKVEHRSSMLPLCVCMYVYI